MRAENLIICYYNFLSALGYTILLPLYTPVGIEKGVSKNTCGIVIGTYAIFQGLVLIYSPVIIQHISKQNLTKGSLLTLLICFLIYAILDSINNKTLFLLLSFLSRIAHGGAAGIMNILVYSLAACYNSHSEEELKYVLGYVEFSFNLGFGGGPFLVSLFYYIGGYPLPFIISSIFIAVGFKFASKLRFDFVDSRKQSLEDRRNNINNNTYNNTYNNTLSNNNDNDLLSEKLALGPDYNTDNNSTILTYFKDIDILNNVLTSVAMIFANNHYFATLSDHLIKDYGISVEHASLFFTIQVFGYFLSLQFIPFFSYHFGDILSPVLGLIGVAIGCFIYAPFFLLPNSLIIMGIGMFICGFTEGLVFIPFYINTNEIFRIKYQQKKEVANDNTASVFNFSFQIGDTLAPILGAFITTNIDFQFSCYTVGVMAFLYSIYYYKYYEVQIKEFLNKNKDDKN